MGVKDAAGKRGYESARGERRRSGLAMRVWARLGFCSGWLSAGEHFSDCAR
jgi:hypothetical protein